LQSQTRPLNCGATAALPLLLRYSAGRSATTLAWLKTVVQKSTVSVVFTTSVSVAPGVSDTGLQPMFWYPVPGVKEQAPLDADALSIVCPGASDSLTVTFVAIAAPTFLTVTVFCALR
jgi:hypothetical protein